MQERFGKERTMIKRFVQLNLKWFLSIIEQLAPLEHQHINQQLQNIKSEEVYYKILDSYNYHYRIPRIFSDRLSTSVLLPQPTPLEYIDHHRWEHDESKWIKHGYYWRRGTTVTKDIQGAGDYDSLESNFYKVQGAKILIADYELLRRDFEFLEKLTELQIDSWLTDKCAYLAEGQILRMQNQLKPFLEEGLPNLVLNKNKNAIRYRGGGRAVALQVTQDIQITKEGLCGQFINVKGAGTEKFLEEIGIKENGFLSRSDAIKQYLIQKLLQKIAEQQKSTWQTVQSYGIIDLNIKFKEGVPNPATGYPGDRFALTLRQSTSRLAANYDQVAFYSVATVEQQTNSPIADFIQTLRKYGISSEKTLTDWKGKGDFSLEGEYNIQADATLTRIIDFSQYYLPPYSQISKWKMTEIGFKEGLLCNGHFMKKLLKEKRKQDLELLLGQHEDYQIAYQQILVKLKIKYGDHAGKYSKSAYSWSWLLQTDDSQLSKELDQVKLLPFEQLRSKLQQIYKNYLSIQI